MSAIGKQIQIDPELHKRLKIRAAHTGNTIIEETEAAIRDRLKLPVESFKPTVAPSAPESIPAPQS